MNAQTNPIQTLVVDDSLDECVLLNAELRSVSFMDLIGFVHDGIEAISYLLGIDQFKERRVFPYPDLLLLDYSMPRCGGMQVLEFLDRQSKRPRVILWSNTLDQINVPLALRLGADIVCHKPSNREELMEIIRRLRMKTSGMPAAAPFLKQPQIVCANA